MFQLGDQRVAAIMTPRVDIEWVDVDITNDELREFLASHSHTEFVVCDDDLDNVLGTVRAAELLPAILRGGDIELRPLDARAALRARLDAGLQAARSVPLLAPARGHRAWTSSAPSKGSSRSAICSKGWSGRCPAMRARRTARSSPRADGSWLVEGSAPIEEVATKFDLEVPADESGAYHTMAGFVLARLGHIPRAADAFDWDGLRFEVVDMDGRRVDKVMVSRAPSPQPPPTDHPSPA